MVKTSVVIPNWNGEILLKKNLPSVLRMGADEVIVVDDASPDDSNKLLARDFPQVKVVKHQKNQGFAAACNSGIAQATGGIVALLNLDVVPQRGCFGPILPHFEDPGVFAVSFNEPNFSWAKISWQRGFLEHGLGPKTEETHPSAWASGGSAAFRKSIWEKLGGFDTLFKPFYWEDIDLSYRAWKRGYRILWEPKAIVHHQHEATIGRHFSPKYIDFISRRNQLLFIWKNITDFKMTLEHRLWLSWRLKNPLYWKVFLAAYLKAPFLLPRRFREKIETNVADREVMALFL